MKGSLLFAGRFYVALVLVMGLLKPAFMLINKPVYGEMGIGEMWDVVCGGFAMDCSMAAYFATAVCLLLIIAQWMGARRSVTVMFRVFFIAVAALVSLIFVLDSFLYGYWGFKLDTTPLFYFMSSPSLAMASAGVGEIVGAVVGVAVLAALLYYLLKYAAGNIPVAGSTASGRWKVSGVMLLCCCLLFIPVRGGVTVSTMNLSSAYFSSDNRLNHAAINPMFSLMYSATHTNDYNTAFSFFDDDVAEANFEKLNAVADTVAETPAVLLSVGRPDIYLIILESFSSHLFPSAGGAPIAVCLDSVASEGLLFDNIYTSSFRTDRGIPAVLSAYPGQPTTSVMKDVAKAESLPSIANSLAGEGYIAEYYYGGDANFTNMQAYLRSAGFGKIISDKDFPIKQRMSKWGVPDGPLFERVAGELTPYDSVAPRFRVIQTSSSHEPFDVDRSPRSADEPKEVTAFAYADSCAASFINRLRRSPSWDKSLVILVPDHYGCYPKGLDDAAARHAVPLIFTGGALALRGVNHTIGSQTDIAATLLGSLGVDHSDFRFSNNLLDSGCSHYAFFSSPNDFSFVDTSGGVSIDVNTDRILSGSGDTTRLATAARSYLQTIYRDLGSR